MRSGDRPNVEAGSESGADEFVAGVVNRRRPRVGNERNVPVHEEARMRSSLSSLLCSK